MNLKIKSAGSSSIQIQRQAETITKKTINDAIKDKLSENLPEQYDQIKFVKFLSDKKILYYSGIAKQGKRFSNRLSSFCFDKFKIQSKSKNPKSTFNESLRKISYDHNLYTNLKKACLIYSSVGNTNSDHNSSKEFADYLTSDNWKCNEFINHECLNLIIEGYIATYRGDDIKEVLRRYKKNEIDQVGKFLIVQEQINFFLI